MNGPVPDPRPKAAVRIALPDPRLSSYVTFYYFVEAFEPVVDFLYPEWGNVRLSLRGDWRVLNDPRDPDVPGDRTLFGPTDRCGRIVTTGGAIAGFGLTPLGWDRLIGIDASLMANRVRELDGALGMENTRLQAGFRADEGEVAAGAGRFDALLLDLLESRPPNSPMVLAADRVLRERPDDVQAFADQVGVSSRTLHRLCLRTFGFPPKRLLRRQRFLETLGAIRISADSAFVDVLGASYFDQSHFNRDFRDFMGMTARSYVRTPRAIMRAAAVAQVSSGVTLSFDLPSPPGEE